MAGAVLTDGGEADTTGMDAGCATTVVTGTVVTAGEATTVVTGTTGDEGGNHDIQ